MTESPGVLPPDTPVTTPVVLPTVATDSVPLDHVPFDASLNVVVDPTHTLVIPVIGPGGAFTVIV